MKTYITNTHEYHITNPHKYICRKNKLWVCLVPALRTVFSAPEQKNNEITFGSHKLGLLGFYFREHLLVGSSCFCLFFLKVALETNHTNMKNNSNKTLHLKIIFKNIKNISGLQTQNYNKFTL